MKKIKLTKLISAALSLSTALTPLTAFAAREGSAVINIAKAEIVTQDGKAYADINGTISSGAAYKEMSFVIKDENLNVVALYQDTTKMQGRFSLNAECADFDEEKHYKVYTTLESGETASKAIKTVSPAEAVSINITRAAFVKKDGKAYADIEGDISSCAAYKEISFVIKDESSDVLLYYQDSTKMQGKFSLNAVSDDFDLSKKYTAYVTLESGETTSCSIDGSFYTGDYKTVENKITSLKASIQDCKNAGLTDCAYEEMTASIAEYFLPIVNQNYVEGDLTLCDNQLSELNKMLDKAQTAVSGYLDGSKTQRAVEEYVNGDLVAENGTLYSVTEDGGRKEKAYLTGYHCFEYGMKHISELKAMGINHITLEVPLGQTKECLGTVFIVPYGFTAWGSDDKSKFMVCADDAVTASGNGSMRIVSKDGQVGVTQNIELKANTVYEYGASVKANTAGAVKLGSSVTEFSAADGWQTVSGSFTSIANAKTAFSAYTSGATDGMYFDDMYVREVGTTENLLTNGNIEQGEIIRSENGDFCYTVEKSWINKIKECMKLAEEENLAVCISLTPHYMPAQIETVSAGVLDTGYNEDGFVIYNPTDEIHNELMLSLYDAVVEELGDSPALQQFMIANEPSFTASESPAYVPKWQAFLEERYGTIGSLNTAYGTSYTAFSQVAMPKEFSLSQIYSDYSEFNDSLLTKTFKKQSEYLKSIAPDIEVVVKTLQSNNYINAHYKAGNHYENWGDLFEINGCDTLTYYGEEKNSLMLRGMWLDYMKSINNAPIADLETHFIRDGSTVSYNDMYAPWVESVLWHGAMHNVYITVPWLFDDGSSFSYENTMLTNRPECMVAVSEINYDLNRLADEIEALQKKNARVAMYYSRQSRDSVSNYPISTAMVYEKIVKNGEKVDFITDSEPERLNSGQYELLILVNSKVASPEFLAEIKEFQESGKTVLVVTTNDVDGSEMLSVMKNGKSNNAATVKAILDGATVASLNSGVIEEKVAAAAGKNVRLVDENGEDLTNCEWSYAKYGSEYVLSITNYSSDETVKAYIEVDGKTVGSFNELRAMTACETYIELAPYTPVLVKTDLVEDDVTITFEEDKVVTSDTVLYNEDFEDATLIVAVYSGDMLIEAASERFDSSKESCTAKLEKKLEKGTYRACRFIFDENISPLVDKKEKSFTVSE